MSKYEIELEFPDFEIVDFHLHFPITQDDWIKPYRDSYIEENGQKKWDELQALNNKQPSWLKDWCFPTPEKTSDDIHEVAKRWYAEVNKYPIDKVFFVTGGTNEILSDVVKMYPDKFVGFAHHYIKDKDADIKLKEAICNQGLVGYKILGPVVDVPLNDRMFDKVWAVCDELKLPVLVHFGILGGGSGIVSGPNMSPLVLGEVAKRFPNINFIVPHFGCGYTNDLLQLCWACPNVYVDTSGNNLWTKWTMESYTLEQLFQKFYSTVGPDRIIYGSDSEWFPRGYAIRYFLDQYRACKNINIPDEDIKKIFRENALRLVKRI